MCVWAVWVGAVCVCVWGEVSVCVCGQCVCVCVWGEVSVVCGLCVIEPSKIANDIYSREIN